MTIVNTGVNYPIERGATGNFKALNAATTLTHALSLSNPLIISPAKGNALKLFGLAPVVTTATNVTVSGSLYGPVVTSKDLSTGSTTTNFYISAGGSTSTNVVSTLNCLPALQLETDEALTVSTTNASSVNIYYCIQEGFLL